MAATKAKKPTTKLKASKKKTTNKWLILGGVAAVAIIGAVVVRFSSAARYSFIRDYKDIKGGYVAKYNGVAHRVIAPVVSVMSAYKPGLATVTGPLHAKKNGGAKICSYFILLSSEATVRIKMTPLDGSATYGKYTGDATKYKGKYSTFNTCVPSRLVDGRPAVTVEATSGTIGVRTIYGVR